MEPQKKTAVHTCRRCSSSLVQPIEWNRLDERSWEVVVRCPECWESYPVVLDQDDVNEFSYFLESAFKTMLDAIKELDHEAFEADCERFATALWANHVLPEDF